MKQLESKSRTASRVAAATVLLALGLNTLVAMPSVGTNDKGTDVPRGLTKKGIPLVQSVQRTRALRGLTRKGLPSDQPVQRTRALQGLTVQGGPAGQPAQCLVAPVNQLIFEVAKGLGYARMWRFQSWFVRRTHDTYMRETTPYCPGGP